MRAIVKNKLEKALESKGWVLLNESEKGFEYIKKYGEYGGVQSVRYNPENGFTSLDPGIPSYTGTGYSAAPINDEDLMLFYKRIKEWRRTYGEI